MLPARALLPTASASAASRQGQLGIRQAYARLWFNQNASMCPQGRSAACAASARVALGTPASPQPMTQQLETQEAQPPSAAASAAAAAALWAADGVGEQGSSTSSLEGWGSSSGSGSGSDGAVSSSESSTGDLDTSQRMTSQDLQAFLDAQGEVAASVKLVKDAGKHIWEPDVIKSLVVRLDGQPWVIVLRGCDRLDEKKLATYMGLPRRRVRMASHAEALEGCGFIPGTVPPFGHKRRLPCLVDAAVARLPGLLYGGGGDPDIEMVLSVEQLLLLAEARVTDVAVPGGAQQQQQQQQPAQGQEQAQQLGAQGAALPQGSSHADYMSSSVASDTVPRQQEQQQDNSSASDATPVGHANSSSLGSSSFSSSSLSSGNSSGSREQVMAGGVDLSYELPEPWPAGSTEVEVMGVVVRKSRIAKLLQFVTIVPLHLAAAAQQPAAGQAVPLRRLWRCPESGSPMELQVIMGKTLERALGREGAVRVMDSVRTSGCVVRVRGRVQPNMPRGGPTPTAGAANSSGSNSNGSSSRAAPVSKWDIVCAQIEVLGREAANAAKAKAMAAAVRASLTAPKAHAHASAAAAGASSREGAGAEIEAAEEEEQEAVQRMVVLEPGPFDDFFGFGEPVSGPVATPGLSSGSKSRRQQQQQPKAQAAGQRSAHALAATLAAAGGPAQGLAPPQHQERQEQQYWHIPASTQVIWVDDEKAVEDMAQHLRQAAAQAAASQGSPLMVGIDAEWAPRTERKAPRHPVALLQVAVGPRVYLVDVSKLARSGPQGAAPAPQQTSPPPPGHATSSPAAAALSPQQQAFGRLVRMLLREGEVPAGRVLPLGFGLGGDIKHLLGSYPWLFQFLLMPHPPAAEGHGPHTPLPQEAGGDQGVHPPSLPQQEATPAATSSQRQQPQEPGQQGQPQVVLHPAVAASLKTVSITGLAGAIGEGPQGSANAAAGATAAGEAGHMAAVEVEVCEVLDLAQAMRPGCFVPSNKKQISLAQLVRGVLGLPLDKAQQRSAWEARPLGPLQAQYAATDAACLLALHDALLQPVVVGPAREGS